VGFAGSVSASASPRPESANTRYQFGGRAPKSRAAPQDEQTEAPWVQGQADRGIASTRAFSPLVPSHFHLACGLTLYSSAGRAAWLDSHKALHLRSRAYWRSEHPCNQPLLLLVVARVPVVILYLCPATGRSRSEGRRLGRIWTPSRAETGGRSTRKLGSKEGRIKAGGGHERVGRGRGEDGEEVRGR
jgi:hypothetical protein